MCLPTQTQTLICHTNMCNDIIHTLGIQVCPQPRMTGCRRLCGPRSTPTFTHYCRQPTTAYIILFYVYVCIDKGTNCKYIYIFIYTHVHFMCVCVLEIKRFCNFPLCILPASELYHAEYIIICVSVPPTCFIITMFCGKSHNHKAYLSISIWILSSHVPFKEFYFHLNGFVVVIITLVAPFINCYYYFGHPGGRVNPVTVKHVRDEIRLLRT